ncbi:MAG: hypothetical protein WCP73_08085 [Eubacteriales bacterium]
MQNSKNPGERPQAHKFPKADASDGKPSVVFPTGEHPHGDRIGIDEDVRVHHAQEHDPDDG